MKRASFALLVSTVLVAGCPRGEEPASQNHRGGMEHNGDAGKGEGQFVFGAPADAADATRTISISALDKLRFEPSAIPVEKGETVTFEVKNMGQTVHEFTLGDEAFQKEHGEEMKASGSMMQDEPNSILLQPGETKKLTWKFSTQTEVLFGCHQPGHYEGGMIGKISVG